MGRGWVGEGAGRDHDVLQVEQIGVLRGRDHGPGRVHQPHPVAGSTAPAGVAGPGVAVVVVLAGGGVIAVAVVAAGVLVVVVAGVVAVGENREDAAAEGTVGEDAEALVGGGAGEVHEREVGEPVGPVGPVGRSGPGQRRIRHRRTGRRRTGEGSPVPGWGAAGRCEGGWRRLVADQCRPVGRGRRRACAGCRVMVAVRAPAVEIGGEVRGQVDAAPACGQEGAVDRGQQPGPPAVADGGGWGHPDRRGHLRAWGRAVGAGGPGSARTGSARAPNRQITGVRR
jgi:hypothetical protein